MVKAILIRKIFRVLYTRKCRAISQYFLRIREDNNKTV